MGLGRLASPAGGPQEALACGLALGRPATAAVRWADRLREKEAFPMWPAITPPTHTHTLTHTLHTTSLRTDAWDSGSNKLCRNKQRWGFNIFGVASERYRSVRRSN